MSHRQRVKAIVIRLCDEMGRAIGLGEIRQRMGPESVPPHLDAVCGSLVRTGDLQAQRARRWEREHRNVYWPVGIRMIVDEDATPASRPEAVARAVDWLWSRRRIPVSSRELRTYMKALGSHPELVSERTLLPTVLNGLRKAQGSGTPIIAAVRLPGVRAQRWIPFGSEWVPPDTRSTDGTKADEVVALTRAAMIASNHLLVTHAEVSAAARGTGHGPVAPRVVARLLSDTTRAVQSAASGRVGRRRPHLVNVGEVFGQAHYTLPEFMQAIESGILPPALVAFEWRRFLEDWQMSRIERELAHLEASRTVPYLASVRLALARERVAVFRARAEDLQRRTLPAAQRDPASAQAQLVLNTANGALRRMPASVEVSGVAGTDERWVTASVAAECLCQDFGLTGVPSHVIQSFLREEVVRRRKPSYVGRTGQNGAFDCRWEYEEVSLHYAGAMRWGSPEIVMLARQGMHIIGPIRDFQLLRETMREDRWSEVDAAAALGMLGDARGLPVLKGLATSGTNGNAGRWVTLASALLKWRDATPGTPSPWRHAVR